jgi:NADPH-dependent 2,4-dienoyl-CoA reductase/sulfur reductase-like enzyme
MSVRGGCVAGALWTLAAVCGAQERAVEAPARTVPVIDRVDVVVVGGNEGGLAAAWQAAKLGARVIVLNEYTFLGGEVAAKDRFDLKDGPQPSTPFSKRLFKEMTPARYPVVASELLLEAGVRFLYNTRHGGVLVDGQGRLCGVVTANKAGLQAVVAKVVVDATCAGAVADAAGAARAPWTATALHVSRPRYSADRKKREVVELDAPMPAFTWDAVNRAENALRETWHTFASPPFAHCMDFVMPNPVVGAATFDGAELPGAGKLDLGVFRPKGTERLYVIGSSAAVSREAVRALMHPVALADAGVRLGEAAAREAAAAALPDDGAVRVKTAAPAAGVLPGLAIRELNEGERPYRVNKRAAVPQAKDAIPVWAEYDVVVVGSGPAGHGAAIAAARAGAKTLMIEQAGFIGGSVALGIKGFWRGYRRGFNQEWRGKGDPQYARLLREAKVDIWYHSLAMGAVMRGNAVAGVEVATWLGRGAVLGSVVIDASGEGDVCAAAGAEFFYLNDGDLCLEEASFIGQKRASASGDGKNTRDRRDLYANTLPADPLDIAGFTTHHVLAARGGGAQHFPMVQLRETRRIKGDYVIDELDVNAGRTYPDVIAVSASAFDPHGFYSSDYSFAGLMPMTKHVRNKDLTVYVPLRALLPSGLENVMAVGRNYSTTHDVQAIVRMNPDVLNLGYAAGHAAALCVKNGTTPRQVDIRALQRHLAEIDILPADRLGELARDLPPPDAGALRAAAQDPANRTNLLTLALGGKAALKPLRDALAEKPTVAKAKALCLLGDPAGVPLLASWIGETALAAGPAYDWEGFLDVPELDGAMWVSAIPRDRRATAALVGKLRQCGAGTSFNTVRSVTMALGRIGDPQAAEALAEFLRKPGVQGYRDAGHDPASLESAQFSKAMVELFAASALYRCGDADGLGRKILTEYLDDWRGVFVRFAGYALEPHK